MATELYAPPDVREAHERFGLTCGPAAFAALLRIPCLEAQRYFPGFPERAYVNQRDMRAALKAAGMVYRAFGGCSDDPRSMWFPKHGLVLVQWTGSWDRPGVHPGAALSRTHWIATSGVWVYDINNHLAIVDGRHDWVPRPTWEVAVVPLIQGSVRGATGWRVRCGIEVEAKP